MKKDFKWLLKKGIALAAAAAACTAMCLSVFAEEGKTKSIDEFMRERIVGLDSLNDQSWNDSDNKLIVNPSKLTQLDIINYVRKGEQDFYDPPYTINNARPEHPSFSDKDDIIYGAGVYYGPNEEDQYLTNGYVVLDAQIAPAEAFVANCIDIDLTDKEGTYRLICSAFSGATAGSLGVVVYSDKIDYSKEFDRIMDIPPGEFGVGTIDGLEGGYHYYVGVNRGSNPLFIQFLGVEEEGGEDESSTETTTIDVIEKSGTKDFHADENGGSGKTDKETDGIDVDLNKNDDGTYTVTLNSDYTAENKPSQIGIILSDNTESKAGDNYLLKRYRVDGDKFKLTAKIKDGGRTPKKAQAYVIFGPSKIAWSNITATP